MGKIGVFGRLILIILRALWLKKEYIFLILIISLSVSLEGEIVSEIKDPITHPVLRGSNAEWNMPVGRLKSNRLCYSSGLHLCEEGFKMQWDNEPKHASKLWRPKKIKGVLTPRSPDPDLALSSEKDNSPCVASCYVFLILSFWWHAGMQPVRHKRTQKNS